MRKHATLWTLLTLLLPLAGGAQDWAGLNVSGYGGMHAALFNPAALSVSRYRLQVGVVAAHSQMSTNMLRYTGSDRLGVMFKGFDLAGNGLSELRDNNLTSGLADIFNSANWQRLRTGDNRNFSATAEVRGPFVAVALGPLAFGLGYRARAGLQVRNASPTITDLFFSNARTASLAQVGLTLSDQQFSAAANAYHELYGTVAFPILSYGQHSISGGITLKYLAGMYSAAIRNNGLEYNVLDSTTIQTAKADVSYQYVSNEDFSFDPFSAKGRGAGFDLGLVYELRSLNEADQPYAAGKGPHLFRAGLSVLDVGYLSYSGKGVRSFDFSRVNQQTIWGSIDTLNLRGTASLDTVFRQVFGANNRQSSFSTGLPAVINVFADLKLYHKFYLAATATQSLTAVSRGGLRVFSALTLIPRYETALVEVGIPLGLGLGYRYLQPGLYARISGFFFGSDNLTTLFGSGNRTGLSFYAGGFVPLKR